ncbi:hypothetical protein [Arthrobacter pityocampae]|nr:hypothetical protein [Arthrobacter pityocampae]
MTSPKGVPDGPRELSESLEGHEKLSQDDDGDSPLEEIEDSPVRTKNS